MTRSVSCGEALISLLESYDVDTVFGIPGVHTLDLYSGLAHSNIRHVQAVSYTHLTLPTIYSV